MTFENVVRGAKNPRDALMALAQELDRRFAELETQAVDLWDTWGDGEDSPEAMREVAGLPTAGPKPFEAVTVPVDEANVARLQKLYDAANARLEKSRRSDPALMREAAEQVESLRAQLALAKNPGSVVINSGDQVGDPESFFQISGIDPSLTPLQQEGLVAEQANMVINLPPATDLQKRVRRQVAEAIDLPGFFPIVQRQTDEARAEIIENFVKGGPLWLYMSGEEGRQILLDMPDGARRAMVHDVAAYGDVRVGHEFARDVMKDYGQGIQPGDAQDYLNSISEGVVDQFGAGFQG